MQHASTKPHTIYTNPSATDPNKVSNTGLGPNYANDTNASKVLKSPPWRVAEDGWGEFELKIDLQDVSGKTHEFLHDLNFQQAKYEVKHVITFKNPKPALLAALRDSGPVPGDPTNGTATSNKRTSEVGAVAGEKKKKKAADSSKAFDMDKLAEGLQKLNEDDLLQVVQMVHDHKSEESWMRNDVERKYNVPQSFSDHD